jgi:mRNA interferase MazF
MIQGDVYWYKFKEPNKNRPVLILTRSDLIPYLHTVTIGEITSTIRGNQSEVLLDSSDEMLEECAVNLTNIQTVSKEKLGAYITHVSAERLSEMREAIEFIFNLKHL